MSSTLTWSYIFNSLARLYLGGPGAMGRPAGTVELKLSEEQIEKAVQGVAVTTEVTDVIHTDLASLFGKCGQDDASITRALLEKNCYILLPLITASPVHTIHIDSLLVSFLFCSMSL